MNGQCTEAGVVLQNDDSTPTTSLRISSVDEITTNTVRRIDGSFVGHDQLRFTAMLPGPLILSPVK